MRVDVSIERWHGRKRRIKRCSGSSTFGLCKKKSEVISKLCLVMASVGELPEVINLEMSRDGTGAGALGATKPIVVEILGNDLQELQELPC